MRAIYDIRPYHARLSAQEAALESIASVLIMHLEDERKTAKAGSAPVLIQVDGPGNIELVDMVVDSLGKPPVDDSRGANPEGDRAMNSPSIDRPAVPWSVVRFDAWQFQRVAPPWWWLITALDRQLHEQFRERGASVLRRKRVWDYRWRLCHFLRDLRSMVPLAIAAIVLWVISGQLPMGLFLRWAVAVAGGLTTLTMFLLSATNAARRLLVASPVNLTTTSRSTDPMANLRLRYSFLVRSSDRPLALVIDNLDRCRAEYVVELLEGIQTLLTNPSQAGDSNRMVAVLVPAEQGWLCDSYLQVYKDFEEAMRQAGRPFGLAFLDRVFDLRLRLPVAIPTKTGARCPADASDRVSRAHSELEIRGAVADAERRYADGFSIPDVRLAAVRRLGTLQVTSSERSCFDTARALTDLIDALAPGQTVVKQLREAYCVQRTTQLLGGHPIDDDQEAIHRLGLWTILALRWPLLAQHLARHPDDLDLLLSGVAPGTISDELNELLDDPQVALLVTTDPGLTADSIRRFTGPRVVYARTPGVNSSAVCAS
jgi:hypothetical protein